MNARWILPTFALLITSNLHAETPNAHQHDHGGAAAAPTTQGAAKILPGLGDWRHPVSTKNAEAQKFFDQGLALAYSFNHDEAIRSFTRAAELDPDLAMAHWGIAFALGPNYNDPGSPEREKAAAGHVAQATKLAAKASEPERAYIAALSKRYSDADDRDLAKLAAAYSAAMGELSKKYPDDLDAATLYADSMMNLRPWKLYKLDGTPEEGTEQLVATLESVLKREPDHLGANHLYIHAVEASNHPERALPRADRLGTIATGAGHIVHMPAHVYMRVGDFEAAATSNEAAIEADREYFKLVPPKPGMYPAMYYSHNIHFLAIADAMRGRPADARKSADELAKHVGPYVKDMPMLEGFMTIPTFVLIRFDAWDDLTKLPEPDAPMPVTRALWQFAQGLSAAATGNTEMAEAAQKKYAALRDAIPPDHMMSPWNKTADVLAIANDVLAARIARAKDDKDAEIAALRKAVESQDKLNYGEPSDWPWPERESLGGALLRAGKPAEAEKVFRDDLEKNPRNGRSLFGLIEALKAQNKTYEVEMIQPQFDEAWKKAEIKLKVESL